MNYNKIAKDLHKTYALTTGPRALTHIQALAVWREFGENLPNDWADNIPKNAVKEAAEINNVSGKNMIFKLNCLAEDLCESTDDINEMAYFMDEVLRVSK